MPLSFSGPSTAYEYGAIAGSAHRRFSEFSQPEQTSFRSVGLPRASQSQQSTIPPLPYSLTKLDARRTHSQQSSFDFSPRPAESGRDSSVSPPTSTESNEAFTPNSPHAEERMSQPYLGLEYAQQKEYQPTVQQHSLMNRAIEGNRPFTFQPAYQPIARPVDYESQYTAMPHHSQQQIFPDRPSYPNFEPRYNFQYQPPAPLTTELYPPAPRDTLPPALIPLLHSPAPQQIPGTQATKLEPDLPPKKRKLSSTDPPKPRRVSTATFACPHPECGAIFSRNYNMQSHLKAHQGIRDFDCLYCIKKFSRRHDRARHIASVHNIPIASQAITSSGLTPPQDDPRRSIDPIPPPHYL